MKLVEDFTSLDISLWKADFDAIKDSQFYKGKKGFNFLKVDYKVPPEGSNVYSFGYPLPDIKVSRKGSTMIGTHFFFPRTTSAIISAYHDVIGPIFKVEKFPNHYVIDKALNYGNSGGPIILEQNGKVISLCSRFQPVEIPQEKSELTRIMIPSLYGETTSLKTIEAFLTKYIL